MGAFAELIGYEETIIRDALLEEGAEKSLISKKEKETQETDFCV